MNEKMKQRRDLLEEIQAIEREQEHVMGHQLVNGEGRDTDNAIDTLKWLEGRGYIKVYGGRDTRISRSMPFAVQVTTAGVDELERGENFGQPPNEPAAASFVFNGGTNAVASGGSNVTQNNIGNLTIGTVLKALEESVEKSEQMSPAQKAEAKTMIDAMKAKMTLGNIVDVTTFFKMIGLPVPFVNY